MIPAPPQTHSVALANESCVISLQNTWLRFFCNAEQISSELKQYYNVGGLEDVRVIRDRQTSKSNLQLAQRETL